MSWWNSKLIVKFDEMTSWWNNKLIKKLSELMKLEVGEIVIMNFYQVYCCLCHVTVNAVEKCLGIVISSHRNWCDWYRCYSVSIVIVATVVINDDVVFALVILVLTLAIVAAIAVNADANVVNAFVIVLALAVNAVAY